MPTYELTCRTCGHKFDLFLTRLLRDEDRVCPKCGSREVSRGIGGGFVSTSSGVSSCVPRGGFS
ncbi:MAG: zinc ribbon domain-containing protein [Coriobacteriia bacterium]|nr:zinc ribbon domain-containing protein [Coriobacteriia bacterium]